MQPRNNDSRPADLRQYTLYTIPFYSMMYLDTRRISSLLRLVPWNFIQGLFPLDFNIMQRLDSQAKSSAPNPHTPVQPRSKTYTKLSLQFLRCNHGIISIFVIAKYAMEYMIEIDWCYTYQFAIY